MRNILTIASLTAAAIFAGPALANDFPNWPLSATCNTADLQCPRFEQRARGEISGVWPTLPPEARSKCLDEVKALEPSYRLLQGCLTLAMQDLLTNQQRHSEGGDVMHDTPKAKSEAEQSAPKPQ